MVSEDVFNASKTALAWYAAFFRDVATELGEEKAFNLAMKYWDRRGTAFAEGFRKQREDGADLNTIAKANVDYYVKLGLNRKAEVSPTTIVYRTDKCPLYDAFKETGLSHANIEAYCAGICRIFDTKLKELYDSNSGYALKFRPSENEVCVEEVFLKP